MSFTLLTCFPVYSPQISFSTPLKEICGEYTGKQVNKVKDILIRDFKEQGIADSMYDLPEPVVCRCMTPCQVKLLKEQWFIKYSDETWKTKTKETLNQACIYPNNLVRQLCLINNNYCAVFPFYGSHASTPAFTLILYLPR